MASSDDSTQCLRNRKKVGGLLGADVAAVGTLDFLSWKCPSGWQAWQSDEADRQPKVALSLSLICSATGES